MNYLFILNIYIRKALYHNILNYTYFKYIFLPIYTPTYLSPGANLSAVIRPLQGAGERQWGSGALACGGGGLPPLLPAGGHHDVVPGGRGWAGGTRTLPAPGTKLLPE
jgi:hypothetical protein